MMDAALTTCSTVLARAAADFPSRGKIGPKFGKDTGKTGIAIAGNRAPVVKSLTNLVHDSRKSAALKSFVIFQ